MQVRGRLPGDKGRWKGRLRMGQSSEVKVRLGLLGSPAAALSGHTSATAPSRADPFPAEQGGPGLPSPHRSSLSPGGRASPLLSFSSSSLAFVSARPQRWSCSLCEPGRAPPCTLLSLTCHRRGRVPACVEGPAPLLGAAGLSMPLQGQHCPLLLGAGSLLCPKPAWPP